MQAANLGEAADDHQYPRWEFPPWFHAGSQQWTFCAVQHWPQKDQGNWITQTSLEPVNLWDCHPFAPGRRLSLECPFLPAATCWIGKERGRQDGKVERRARLDCWRSRSWHIIISNGCGIWHPSSGARRSWANIGSGACRGIACTQIVLIVANDLTPLCATVLWYLQEQCKLFLKRA